MDVFAPFLDVVGEGKEEIQRIVVKVTETEIEKEEGTEIKVEIEVGKTEIWGMLRMQECRV